MAAELLQFIIKHWILSSALLLTLILLFLEESKNKAGGFKLSLQDVTTLINHEQAVLIDLRDNAAFEKGHIVNALNFPQAEIMSKLDKLKKYQNRPVILIDNTGQHANSVVNQLRKQGFAKACALVGGLKTWTDSNLPLTKSQLPSTNSRKLTKQ